MTHLLLRLFVRNHQDVQDPHTRTAIGALSGWVGIGCNLLLFAVKIIIGMISGSVSISADAMNNLSDASGSIVTLIGFRVADKPADEHHPYGHARAEYLSGLAVAVMILFIGLELGKSSLKKIWAPAPVTVTVLSGGILLLSIFVKLWLSLFYRTLGKKIGSNSLLASAADSRNDCIATAAVLVSAYLENCFNIRSDGFLGLAIAMFIFISGWQLVRHTISSLLGENADPQLRGKIVAYISRQPKVLGYHDLMIHDYGPGQRYASLHVEMDYREDPLECHALIDDMEWECLRDYNVHLVIHYDPVTVDDPELVRLQAKVQTLLQSQDSLLHIHDFRMIQGTRHMNLLFHVPLPPNLRGQEQIIQQRVADALNANAERVYHVTITFDSPAFN